MAPIIHHQLRPSVVEAPRRHWRSHRPVGCGCGCGLAISRRGETLAGAAAGADGQGAEEEGTPAVAPSHS